MGLPEEGKGKRKRKGKEKLLFRKKFFHGWQAWEWGGGKRIVDNDIHSAAVILLTSVMVSKSQLVPVLGW